MINITDQDKNIMPNPINYFNKLKYTEQYNNNNNAKEDDNDKTCSSRRAQSLSFKLFRKIQRKQQQSPLSNKLAIHDKVTCDSSSSLSSSFVPCNDNNENNLKSSLNQQQNLLLPSSSTTLSSYSSTLINATTTSSSSSFNSMLTTGRSVLSSSSSLLLFDPIKYNIYNNNFLNMMKFLSSSTTKSTTSLLSSSSSSSSSSSITSKTTPHQNENNFNINNTNKNNHFSMVFHNVIVLFYIIQFILAQKISVKNSIVYINSLYKSSIMTTSLIISIILLTTSIQPSLARQVILLDTTQESSLDWTRLPYGPQARTPGWVEESFTNFEQGINWRSYVVCDVAYNNVNNWLWTPFIERHNANRIYIEIKFSMRDCNLFPGMALSCKETFSLLYYEHDGLNKEPPPWEPESYKLIDRIAADEGRFTSNSEVIINTEIRSVPVTKKGVYFAFRDQGACLSIIAIKIFYITCPNITTNFAYYPETPTGRELTTIVETDGVCVANSQQVEIPRLLCKGDGNWTLPSGGCKCMPGYEPMGQSCQVCPSGKFKPIVGDELCQPCPAHSKSSYHGSTECRCDVGYYRAAKDPKWMPCTQPPSAPQNLTINFLDQSTVILTWNEPKFLGGRNDTVYRITCDYCPSSTNYVPSQDNINDTRVVISGLNPMTSYRFQVYAENGVSGYDSSQFVEITATTEASGYISLVITEDSSGQKYNAIPATTIYPPIMRVISADGTQITLGWKMDDNINNNMNNDPSNEITAYELRYHSNDLDRNTSSILFNRDQFETTITGLKPLTEYAFQIRSRTKTGWSEFSKALIKTTGQRVANPAYISGDNDSVQTRIIIVGIILLIIVATFIISLILFYIKKNNEDCNKKQPSDCDTLEYRSCGMEGKKLVSTFDHAPIVPTPRFNSTFSVATPLFTNCTTSRSYVDPHTYEDPNQAIKEFTKEIDASHITIEAIIGGGEFGDVCRGKLKIPGKMEVTVAIKTLKPTTAEKPRLDFLTEASIMGQFDHSNVIYLQGVVTKTNPIMIITEYMEHGSLDAFLRANEGKFTILQLIGMLRGIASGMEYLSTMNYVHRDLAARNVLVNSSFICKIADFGLSREIESATEGAYTTRGGKIPVRWTAPEAIAFRKFTSASDVWSFGIVCWEVMSYGERPYWNWSNQDVIKSIEKGYRLPPPIDCPDAVYQLMLESWQKDRSNRPTFTQIVKTLDKLAKCPENLMKLAQQMNRVDPFMEQPASIPDVIQFKSFYEWLASIKMSRYQINFEHAGINNLSAVARLSLQDLMAIGVDIPSHQKKIMNSIYSLRAQNSIGSPEGFLV